MYYHKINKFIRECGLICIITLLSPPVFAEPVLNLSDAEEVYLLGKYIAVLEDVSGELTINDIAQLQYQNQYRTFEKNAPNLGFSKSVFWVRLHIKNNSTQNEWILDQSFANIHYLDLYTPLGDVGDGKTFKETRSGNLRSFSGREIPHRRIIFKLALDPGEASTVYLRLENQAAISLNFKMWSIDAFADADRVESFWLGLFYGFIFVLLAGNLLLYFLFRKSNYVYLVVLIASTAGALLFYDGYAQMLFNADIIESSRHFLPMFLSVAMLALIYYGRNILSVFTHNRYMQGIQTAMIILLVFIFLMEPLIDYHFTILLLIPLLLIVPLFLLVTGIICWKMLNISTRLIVTGFLIFSIGFAGLELSLLGYIESHLVFSQGIRFSLILLILFMSLEVIEHFIRMETREIKTNKALSESENKFRAIFNQTFQLVVVMSPEGRVLEMNDTALKNAKFSAADVIGNYFENIPWWAGEPVLQRKLQASVQQAARGEFCRFELNLSIKEDEQHWMDFSLKPYRDEAGNISMLIAEGRDISERKRAEEALSESEEKFRLISEQSLIGIVIVQDDVFKYMNQTITTMSGYNMSTMMNWKPNEWVSKIIHPEDMPIVIEQVKKKQSGATDVIQNYSCRSLTKSGEVKWVEIFSRSIQYNGKTVDLVTILDIHERKRTEQAINSIAVAIEDQSGDALFHKMVNTLSKLFAAKYVFIGLFDDEGSQKINTIAFSVDGVSSDNMTYYLKDTPCENVIGKKTCVYTEGIQRRFPKDIQLQTMGAESYVGTPLFDENNNPLGLIVVIDTKPLVESHQLQQVLEIFAARTGAEIERMKAGKALRESEIRFRQLAENINAVFWLISPDWKEVTYVSPAYTKFLGLNPETLYNNPREWLKVVHPDDQEQVADDIAKRTIDKDERIDFREFRIKKPDGETRWIKARAYPIRDDNKKIIRMAGIAEDITEGKLAQQALLNKEKDQREILNSLVDGVITIDEPGTILTLNKAAEELFGYTAKEIIGKNINHLLFDNVGNQSDDIKRYFENGESDNMAFGREVEAKRKNNETFPIRLSVVKLPRIDEGKSRFIASCQDLTQRKQKEEQLRRSQKMDALGKLTGGISHDYNNMLGVVLGYAELLENQLSDKPKLAAYVKEIIHASDRGAKLSKKLMSFSRQKSSDAEVLNINSILLEEKNMLEKTLTPRIKLVLELEVDLWSVRLDSSDFEDAIFNMCINAMHAIEVNGQLTVQTSNVNIKAVDANLLQLREGDHVMFSITDTGYGMDNETKEKIFDPFFSTKGDKGTGLGLSQVYGFVERSESSIRVYSESGHGTRFVIYFPRYREHGIEGKSNGEDNEVDLRGTETIMLVDDELGLLKVTSEILGQYGYTVICANSGKKALKLLKTASVDLLLSDVIMPEMDGFQLASIVLEKYPAIKIQMASGFDDNRHRNIADKNLQRNLLQKPLNSQILLKRIRKLLN